MDYKHIFREEEELEPIRFSLVVEDGDGEIVRTTLVEGKAGEKSPGWFDVG